MNAKLSVIFCLMLSILAVSCAKKETDFKPQIIELKDEDLNALISAQEQELITQDEILVFIEEYKSGLISKEEMKLKIQAKILSNGLEKKKIKLEDTDIEPYFLDKENDFKDKGLSELISAYLNLAVSAEAEMEKNGLNLDQLDKLRLEQDENLFKIIHALNSKISSYDLSAPKSLGKMLDLIHIHNFSLINHLSRNELVINKDNASLADLTVSQNPLELMTHAMVKIGGRRLDLASLQQMILEAAPTDLFKLYIPFMLITGAKGQGHLLNHAYSSNQLFILGQIQTVVGATLKYSSYVQIEHEQKKIHLNKLFFSLYKDQMGEGFDAFIKNQLVAIYGLAENELAEYTLELDLEYDYTIDRV